MTTNEFAGWQLAHEGEANMSMRTLCSLVLGVLCAGAAWSADTTPATAARELRDLRKLTTLLADTERPITWLFTGDSITHGAKHTGGYRSYPDLFSERIRWELGVQNKVRMRDAVINTGISGHRCPDLLGDWEWSVARFKGGVGGHGEGNLPSYPISSAKRPCR